MNLSINLTEEESLLAQTYADTHNTSVENALKTTFFSRMEEEDGSLETVILFLSLLGHPLHH